MTTWPADTFWDSSKTEGEASAGWFYKTLDAWKELMGGAEQVPELTISTGVIVPNADDASRGAAFSVDTEADAASDDLSSITITNTPEGRLLLLRANNTARTVVVKHEAGGSGQISLIDNADFSLDDDKKWIGLVLEGTTWKEVFRGTNISSDTMTLTNKTFDADGTGNSLTNIDNANIKASAAIDATKIADGSVSNTEFQYIGTVSSNVQDQLDSKTTITIGTVAATTSGTSIDYTSIPSGTKRIMINFYNVSTNGTSGKVIQIGDSGGIEASGYSGSYTGFADATAVESSDLTTGWGIYSSAVSDLISGSIVLTLLDASTNSWAASGVFADGDTAATQTFITAGSKSLSDVLDRVRITTINGTDTFDAGKLNIMYE